jgi:hypothetical protein
LLTTKKIGMIAAWSGIASPSANDRVGRHEREHEHDRNDGERHDGAVAQVGEEADGDDAVVLRGCRPAGYDRVGRQVAGLLAQARDHHPVDGQGDDNEPDEAGESPGDVQV